MRPKKMTKRASFYISAEIEDAVGKIVELRAARQGGYSPLEADVYREALTRGLKEMLGELGDTPKKRR